MIDIERTMDRIDDEIDDAEKYAKDALDSKQSGNLSLAELSFKLSNEELGHMNLLHAQIVAMIEAYKKEKGEPPPDMLRMYNIFHKKHIERVGAVRGLLALYKDI